LPDGRSLAIITGASQGIGAGLVAGFRRAGYFGVGTSRSNLAGDEADYLAVQGDPLGSCNGSSSAASDHTMPRTPCLATSRA
jgi:NAD(P)-dependent dehydrogenase (short-subunit alcohol dehydrogenase family)